MAFGQPAGPPATAKQLQQLTDLVAAAGHDGFRDARGPLGLTQRQAAGKFTRAEADELIERLQAAEAAGDGSHAADDAPPNTPSARPAPRAPRASAPPVNRLRSVPSTELAAELQRRGWVVMEP